VALGFTLVARHGHPMPSHLALIASVAITTTVWVLTTLLTTPTERGRLVAFYRLVRPAGPGWREIRAATGLGPAPDSLPQAFLCWVLGVAFVHAALFGVGTFLYGHLSEAMVWLLVFVVSGVGLLRLLPRMWGDGQS
jgi:hypothetical protein